MDRINTTEPTLNVDLMVAKSPHPKKSQRFPLFSSTETVTSPLAEAP